MNRRSFLQALGLGAAGVVLSPMLDLAPIVAAPSIPTPNPEYVAWVTVRVRMFCHYPARCARLDGLIGAPLIGAAL